MKSPFCQWATDLQALGMSEGIIIEAQHMDYLEFKFKSGTPLPQVLGDYKDFKRRYSVLTEGKETATSTLFSWIKVTDIPKQVLEESREVFGYNPLWIDPDFNPNGTRVCFYQDMGWQSAKYCTIHDRYEHRCAADDDKEVDVPEYSPTHVFIVPDPVGEGTVTCACENGEHINEGKCITCGWVKN